MSFRKKTLDTEVNSADGEEIFRMNMTNGWKTADIKNLSQENLNTDVANMVVKRVECLKSTK